MLPRTALTPPDRRVGPPTRAHLAGARKTACARRCAIEVRYQISNRFLHSRSLAEELSGDGIEVELTYDALVIPAYLTKADLEVHGDETRGMQAFGLLRDSAGTPLALCRLTGLAYRDALEVAQTRLDAGMRWLLVLALALGWVAAGAAVGRRTSRVSRLGRSPLLPILAIWSIRRGSHSCYRERASAAVCSIRSFAMVASADAALASGSLLTALVWRQRGHPLRARDPPRPKAPRLDRGGARRWVQFSRPAWDDVGSRSVRGRVVADAIRTSRSQLDLLHRRGLSRVGAAGRNRLGSCSRCWRSFARARARPRSRPPRHLVGIVPCGRRPG